MYFIKICDMRRCVLFVMTLWLLNACGYIGADPDGTIREQAQRFAEAYFSCNYAEACRLATPESEKWLRFAASNVTQEDVDFINAASETVSAAVTECYHENDSTARVVVTVYNGVLKDSLARPAYVAADAWFTLTLVNREGTYLVRMEGLPRNGRQSRGSVSGE